MSYGGRGEMTAFGGALHAYGMATIGPIGVDGSVRGCPKGVEAADATLLLLLRTGPSKNGLGETGVDCGASMAALSKPFDARDSRLERGSSCVGCMAVGVASP